MDLQTVASAAEEQTDKTAAFIEVLTLNDDQLLLLHKSKGSSKGVFNFCRPANELNLSTATEFIIHRGVFSALVCTLTGKRIDCCLLQ